MGPWASGCGGSIGELTSGGRTLNYSKMAYPETGHLHVLAVSSLERGITLEACELAAFEFLA